MDKNLYQFAEDFIKSKNNGLIPTDYDDLINGGGHLRPFNSLNDVYCSILESAVNRVNFNRSIKFSCKGHLENSLEIKKILFDFDISKILNNYNNWEEIHNEFAKSNELVKGAFGKFWKDFARTSYDAAKLLGNFNNLTDFKNFANCFILNKSNEFKFNLPEFFANNIYGIAFALGCDFLKELGYDFPKPDTHINDIYKELTGLNKKDKEYAIDLMNTAEKSNVSNYKLDKILWVICAVDLMNAKSEFINEIILKKAHIIF